MAGDWIPIRKDLTRCAEVCFISEATDLKPREVVGSLVDFWSWVDSETGDGFIPNCNTYSVRIAADICPQFVQALADVNWIRFENNGLTIVHFDSWFASTAKRRLQDTRRKRQSRQQIERPHLVRKKSASHADKMRTTEQDSIEHDKSKTTTTSDHKVLIEYFCEKAGSTKISDFAAQGGAVKWLLSAGYSVEQCKECLDSQWSEDWRSRPSWLSVKKDIAVWLARRGLAGNGKGNGYGGQGQRIVGDAAPKPGKYAARGKS